MCITLDVSRGGYYTWLDRAPSATEQRRQELGQQVLESYEGSHGLYGSPRITADLRARGIRVSEKTVAKSMRRQDLRARTLRRFRPRTTDSSHAWKPAENLLKDGEKRDFAADKVNAKWACDITYVPTEQGYLYLAAIIDLCSRRIVGWSLAEHLRASLPLEALEMAILHRRPGEGLIQGLIHHSDRGTQYCCDDYQKRLEELGIRTSMSGRGDCYDNAVIESFWGTYKQELLYLQPKGRFGSFEQARVETFKYIEIFYNRQRRHSAIGYLSPDTFEASLN
jgi:transposase InsO family protein